MKRPASYKKVLFVLFAGLLLAWSALKLFASPHLSIQPAQSPLGLSVELHLPEYLHKEEPFSQLLQDLRAGKVRVLAVSANGDLLADLGGGTKYYVHNPAPGSLLAPALEQASAHHTTIITIRASTVPLTPASTLTELLRTTAQLYPLLMLALMAGLAVGAVRGLRSARTATLVPDTGVRFSDVIGAEDAKQSLQDVVEYLRNPRRFADFGARAPRGVLLEGPPGTGKTLLARAVAGECKVPFFSVNGANFSAPFVGIGVMRVKALFRQAAKQAPCVIFIDEVDGLGSREGQTQGGAAETENRRIINAILTELDGFDERAGVVVIAATNHAEHLDKGLTREGRFDRRCVLGLPNLAERVGLYELYLRKVRAKSNLDLKAVSRLSAGLSPSAIATVVNAAALQCVKQHRPELSQEDLVDALHRQQMGAPNEATRQAMTEAVRRRTAFHEAGHAIVGWATGFATLDGVTIIPRSRALGVTLLSQDHESVLLTKTDLEKLMTVYLGGRCAELLVYGEASSGARDDLEKATSAALQMVCEYGLAGSLEPASYAALGPQAYTLARPRALRDARDLVLAAQARASDILRSYREALNALAEQLLEKESLSGEEALGVLNGFQPAVSA